MIFDGICSDAIVSRPKCSSEKCISWVPLWRSKYFLSIWSSASPTPNKKKEATHLTLEAAELLICILHNASWNFGGGSPQDQVWYLLQEIRSKGGMSHKQWDNPKSYAGGAVNSWDDYILSKQCSNTGEELSLWNMDHSSLFSFTIETPLELSRIYIWDRTPSMCVCVWNVIILCIFYFDYDGVNKVPPC